MKRAMHANFGVEFIPKGWELVAPGRAQRAPGEGNVENGSAPRQGCEDREGCNPSGVGFVFDAFSPGGFAPGATGWNASGVRAGRCAYPGNGILP